MRQNSAKEKNEFVVGDVLGVAKVSDLFFYFQHGEEIFSHDA